MDHDNYELVFDSDGLQKYVHNDEPVVAYVPGGYTNSPELFIRRLSINHWMTRLETNGSFTNMKASGSDFKRALDDGKRMLNQYGDVQ